MSITNLWAVCVSKQINAPIADNARQLAYQRRMMHYEKYLHSTHKILIALKQLELSSIQWQSCFSSNQHVQDI